MSYKVTFGQDVNADKETSAEYRVAASVPMTPVKTHQIELDVPQTPSLEDIEEGKRPVFTALNKEFDLESLRAAVTKANPFESITNIQDIVLLYHKAAYLNDKDALQQLVGRGKAGFTLAEVFMLRVYALGQAKIKRSIENAQAISRRYSLWLKDKSTNEKDNCNVYAKFLFGVCYEYGLGRNVNMQQAITYYRDAAIGGYDTAQCFLGTLYEEGHQSGAIKKDPAAAVQWYRLAADNTQHVAAQFNLARCLWSGKGLRRADPKEAVKYFILAAEQGNANAMINLGVAYKEGVGVDAANHDNAVYWYNLAAEQGHPVAQYNLGLSYDRGEGVNRNAYTAVEWYRKSAEQGNADAQYLLGCAYKSGIGIGMQLAENEGASTPLPNLREATKWFKLSADQGNADAQCALGLCFKNGTGVNIDYAEAIRLLKLSAAQSNASAQCILAKCLETGQCVPRNLEAAVRWYRLSADNGNKVAQNALGCCYKSGTGVATPDFESAIKYFRLSAEQNFAPAMNNLGLCFMQGAGVPRDKEQARRWFGLAAKQSNETAERNLTQLRDEGDEKNDIETGVERRKDS